MNRLVFGGGSGSSGGVLAIWLFHDVLTPMHSEIHGP
jgi:hypothetical protein